MLKHRRVLSWTEVTQDVRNTKNVTVWFNLRVLLQLMKSFLQCCMNRIMANMFVSCKIMSSKIPDEVPQSDQVLKVCHIHWMTSFNPTWTPATVQWHHTLLIKCIPFFCFIHSFKKKRHPASLGAELTIQMESNHDENIIVSHILMLACPQGSMFIKLK